MHAYDLDGVLCPEFRQIPAKNAEQILLMTLSLQPIFQPKHPYVIITGRTNSNITMQWIQENLKLQPKYIFINEENIKPELFKVQTLNSHPNIEYFTESCPEQTKYIRKYIATNCYVRNINDHF